MRIAFVTSEFVTEANFDGGLSNYLGRVSRALLAEGHEVVVIVRSDRDEQIDFHGVEVHRVAPRWDAKMRMDHVDPLCPRSLYMPYQDVKAAWAVWRCWQRLEKAQSFDLIQLTNVMSIGLFFRRQRKVPMCLRLSSFHPEWTERTGGTPDRAARWRSWMEQKALRGFRFAYAPTAHVAAMAKTYYGMKEVSVLATPFFRDMVTGEAPSDAFPSGPFALFFGAKNRIKGMVELAGALPGFLRRCPEWQVVCIGKDGTAPGGGSMETLLRDAAGGEGARLELLPPMPHARLYEWIQRAELILIPSIADNLPNAALEALGLGRPVLTTDVAGLGEYVVSGETGWVIPAGDADALEGALLDAAAMSPAERDTMGKRGAERIKPLLPEQAIPRLVSYYESVRSRWT